MKKTKLIKMKIAVLFGGWSPEREISLKSGENIAKNLKNMGHDVTLIDVKKNLKYITEELYKINPDFVFNALHGIGGEDGVIQGVLEIFGVPFSNTGVLGSAISFDKSLCKKIVQSSGVRIIDGFDIFANEIQSINSAESNLKIDYPFVVKPAANGSSVGVFLIFNENDLENLKNTKWTFGDRVVVEKYIKGREFTVLILDGKAIGAIEITFKNEFYDYESKYEIGGSSHISSYEMNEKAFQEMLKSAEKVFKACVCKGIARADFRYDDEHVYFLEINTQPGMTDLSLVPDIARFKGIKIEDLLNLSINVNSQ